MGTFFPHFLFTLSHDGLCRLIFDTSADINVQSRANSIRSGIPNAIFRQAEQAFGGLQSVFQNPNGFLGYTEKIYVCYRPFFDDIALDVGL
jgi:hypothetical protein